MQSYKELAKRTQKELKTVQKELAQVQAGKQKYKTLAQELANKLSKTQIKAQRSPSQVPALTVCECDS